MAISFFPLRFIKRDSSAVMLSDATPLAWRHAESLAAQRRRGNAWTIRSVR
ncbi:hypothetical protein [Burkholderia vietnamiensis]|uniref:hypothetical protein n=1 Tax=Burkholderia vietnamiensis TaxID=60552 RepID=UPI0012DB4480|nr:hypothetical protein [Burkholderia vietnamiensis]